jgi:hypothetical protein
MCLLRLLLVFALALSACRSDPPPDIRFDAEEAAFIGKPGKTMIKGEAFLPDENGDVNVRYAAGEIIRLIPATSYARARNDYTFQGEKFVRSINIPTLDSDPGYRAHMRTTKTDARGHFIFENVPPGAYLLTTQVIWKPKKSFFSEGGLIYDEVTITGEETKPVEVILSGK